VVYLKACPRCRGDLFVERDQRSRFLTCLQCGHVLSSQEEFVIQLRANQWVEARVPRLPRLT
jgi:hypothetical protein